MRQNERPLVVDLDGTLIHSDILLESIANLLRDKPYLFLALPFWLLKGKAAFKSKLASHVNVDIKSLPFNTELIKWLKLQKTCGRRLLLCTASNFTAAERVAKHLDLFDGVLASDDTRNLAGRSKALILENLYGKNGFDYVGNSKADLFVWEKSKVAVIVNGSKKLIKHVASLTEIGHNIPKQKIGIKDWINVFRSHQWIKNLLIFVPVLAAHQLITFEVGKDLILAFLSFSFCASSVYILNDLLDLESDRRHLRKCSRPFASGRISLLCGLAFAPILLITSISIAININPLFLFWLLIYFGITCAYSWGLKRLVLVDCLTLAILYTLRIVAGAVAVSVPLSFWLLAFSTFIFLSLAFVKRFAELEIQPNESNARIYGRGYYPNDSSLIKQLGISSGFSAVLVLALYLNSDNVTKLYQTPEIIWGAIPLMLLWISWMWLQAQRGTMHDDPIIFAIKDNTSILIGLAFISIFIIAGI